MPVLGCHRLPWEAKDDRTGLVAACTSPVPAGMLFRPHSQRKLSLKMMCSLLFAGFQGSVVEISHRGM